MTSRAELQRRLDAVCDEIRRYPTPIARCDEQLTALIEERSAPSFSASIASGPGVRGYFV